METETRLLQVTDIQKDYQAILQTAAVLKAGGLAAVPTETVYGLAADAGNAQAVEGIFRAKKRPADNPLIVHIAALETLELLAREIPDTAHALAEAFWPGPLTIILPKQASVPSVTSGGLDTVAIRFPSHSVMQAVIREAGCPLAAPSANLSGSPSPTTAEHCVQDLSGRVEVILDGGPCQVGVESTVVSLASKIPRLLRPGYVTLEELKEVLGQEGIEADPAVVSKLEEGRKAASPGMKYKHYAPKAKIVLLEGSQEEFIQFVNQQKGEQIFALTFGPENSLLSCPCETMGEKGEEQARRLFGCLRALDDRGAQVVYARCPQKEGVGLAVYNRLLRAAAFDLRKL